MITIRALAIVAALLVLTGGCSAAGRSFGRYVDDKAISGKVRVGLATAHLIGRGSHSHIAVDTFDATVYLSGIADTAAHKAEAERVARRVKGVVEVVNDLQVHNAFVAASPALPAHDPLLDRLPGIHRLDPAPAATPRGPALAYDASGRLVATVYTVSMRELAEIGFEQMRTARPIDHVSILPEEPSADIPDSHYRIVLWHITATDASRLQ